MNNAQACVVVVVVVVCIDYAGVECMNTGVDVINKVYFPALFGACPCWCISAHAPCAIPRSSGEGTAVFGTRPDHVIGNVRIQNSGVKFTGNPVVTSSVVY